VYNGPGGWRFILPAALVIVVVFNTTASAQKTDIVTLANGDRITGEVSTLNRGQLEYKTDDTGTLYIEWDKIATVTSTRQFEVGTSDGQRFVGSLRSDPGRVLVVVESTGPVSLLMTDVTVITAIGRSFWNKLDGSVDIGFSYTKSSDIAQLNINAGTVYRSPSFEARASVSGTATQTSDDEEGRDDRGAVQMSYLRYRGARWFVGGGAGFETNESLGIKLRSQISGAVGQRLVNTNRAQLSLGAGLSVNDEHGVDSEPTQNVEAIMTFRTSYYAYDYPKSNIDVAFQYFPSLSDFGRQRIQFDSNFRRELWKDVFLSVNVFDTFDSQPPSVDADSNDVGVVTSFGLSF
jgi:Protein of unknown function, DUF481